MKLKEFVRNPYNYDVNELSDDTGTHCKDEHLARQEFVEEADINYIAEKFMRTGELREVVNMPTQGDFEGIFDYQTAMNTIVVAKTEFAKLPAKMRERFQHDPSKLLDFLQDEDNRDEAIKMGLVAKPEPRIPPTPAPDEKPAASPSAEPGSPLPGSNPDKPVRK